MVNRICLNHQIYCVLNQTGITAQSGVPPVDGGMFHHWFTPGLRVRFALVRQWTVVYESTVRSERILNIRLAEGQYSRHGIPFVRKGKMGVVCFCFVASRALPTQQQAFYRDDSLIGDHVKYAFALFMPLEQARFNLATWAIRQSTGRQTLIYQVRVMLNLFFSC